MTLKRIIIPSAALATIVLGWFAAVHVIIPMRLAQGAANTVPPLDYADPNAWLVRPSEPPPAVWDGGWAIDFFVLPPAPQGRRPHGLVDPVDEALVADQLAGTANLLDALSRHGAVYMPALRWPSPMKEAPMDLSEARSDLLESFETYVKTENRGRAVIMVYPETHNAMVRSITAAFTTQFETIETRFVGIFELTSRANASRDAAAFCAPDFEANCALVLPAGTSSSMLDPLLPSRPTLLPALDLADPITANELIADHTRAALEHLDSNVPKTAEPLGELVPVEVPEIRRPGQTDEPDPARN